jgi:hypothetical protein
VLLLSIALKNTFFFTVHTHSCKKTLKKLGGGNGKRLVCDYPSALDEAHQPHAESH